MTRKYYNQVDITQLKLAAKRKSKSRTRRTKSKARRKTTKTRRTKSKAKSRKKSRSKPKRKSGSKKKPFGGYGIVFAGRKETLEQVFGKGKVTPSEMTKKIWKFVKAKRLSTR